MGVKNRYMSLNEVVSHLGLATFPLSKDKKDDADNPNLSKQCGSDRGRRRLVMRMVLPGSPTRMLDFARCVRVPLPNGERVAAHEQALHPIEQLHSRRLISAKERREEAVKDRIVHRYLAPCSMCHSRSYSRIHRQSDTHTLDSGLYKKPYVGDTRPCPAPPNHDDR